MLKLRKTLRKIANFHNLKNKNRPQVKYKMQKDNHLIKKVKPKLPETSKLEVHLRNLKIRMKIMNKISMPVLNN